MKIIVFWNLTPRSLVESYLPFYQITRRQNPVFFNLHHIVKRISGRIERHLGVLAGRITMVLIVESSSKHHRLVFKQEKYMKTLQQLLRLRDLGKYSFSAYSSCNYDNYDTVMIQIKSLLSAMKIPLYICINVQSVFLVLAVLNRMRSGFGRVH
jgi:hypothetical protein